MPTIRLSCLFCDRRDFDGFSMLPTDWFAVDRVQTYQESIRAADLSEPVVSLADCCTHMGVCPKCQQIELWPTELSA